MKVSAKSTPKRQSVLAQSLSIALLTMHAWPVLSADAVGAGSLTPEVLDSVVVTAQRRSQEIGKVPISVTVITPAALQAYGAAGQDVLQLSGKAPSLYAESSFGRTFPRFYIRGLGNTDFDLNASQPVSMVYDDIVLENATLKGFPIFDIEQIEVLRGPQGTLFGRNTPGGVIKFDSVRPDSETSGFARIGYSRFDTLNVEAALGGAVSDNSSARLSVLYQDRNGISRNTQINGDLREGFTDTAFRGQWLYAPDTGFEALLQINGRDLEGGSAVYRANLYQTGSNQIGPGFDRYSLSQDAVPTLTVETFGGSARLSWAFDNIRLISITGYQSLEMFARGDVDGGFGASFAPPSGPGFIPFPAESGDGIPDHRQVTQEFRLESTGNENHDWQLGVFYFDESLDIENFSYDTLSGSQQNGFARQHQDNSSYAVYGSGGLALSEQWRLSGGLRYTHDSKDFWAERIESPFGAGALPRVERNLDDGKVSGDLNVVYALSSTSMAYGRVASGFRAPSIQGRVLFGDTVSVADSESIISYELGYKAELFDRRLRLAADVFTYALDDAQLTAVGGQANFNTLINARQVNGQGVEINLDARITRNLLLSVGASYNDTEIDDPSLAVAACASPCTVLDPASSIPGTVSIDGNPLPQSPRWIANLVLDYVKPVSAGDLFVLADISYRSEVNFFLYQSVEFTGKPLTEVGLRLGYRWDGGRYESSLFARNLFDETVVLGGVDFNNLTGFVNEPRTVGVEFKVSL